MTKIGLQVSVALDSEIRLLIKKWVNSVSVFSLLLALPCFFTSCSESVAQVCAVPGDDKGKQEPGERKGDEFLP